MNFLQRTLALFVLLLVSASAQGPPRFGGEGPPRRPGDDSAAPEGRGGGRGGMRGMMMMRMAPVMRALDKDEDGEISAEEIAAAPTQLATLDEDENGILEGGELAPRFPGRGGRGRGEVEGEPVKPEDLEFEDGTASIPNRETFKKLSYQGAEVLVDTHLSGMEFVKFQIEKADTDHPDLYFINTKTHRGHPMFMGAVNIEMLGRGDERESQMRGVLIYRPMAKAPNGEPGVYTFEYEPNDDYAFEAINMSRNLLVDKMPLLKGRVGYCPLSRDSVARYVEETKQYEDADLSVYFEEDLLGDIAFLPLNPAESYGRLRILAEDTLPSARDIVLCKVLPNEMPRTAGVVSAVRQTPLSHVNLRAIQDKVPNAFIAGIAENPEVQALLDKNVYYRVSADGYELREATVAEMEAHLSARRPKEIQVLPSDLTKTSIRPLKDLNFSDSLSIGVKAANLAAMHQLGLPSNMIPKGHAIPFYFYVTFMQHNGFDVKAKKLIADVSLADDREALQDELKDFRKKIKKGDFPDTLRAALTELQNVFDEGTSIRCRSSTNNEDLQGFSGAGLYDSYTHHPDEGHLSKSIRQVYASIWNLRAFEERAFYRIDHLSAAMGVLLHPNFSDEIANGVAVTDDILYQTDGSYYVNTQIGEDLVTNPEQASAPEEYLLDWRRSDKDRLMRVSNRVSSDKEILSESKRDELRDALGTVHAEFAKLYQKKIDDPKFAMEIEFKLTKEGELAVKQARPWVY